MTIVQKCSVIRKNENYFSHAVQSHTDSVRKEELIMFEFFMPTHLAVASGMFSTKVKFQT